MSTVAAAVAAPRTFNEFSDLFDNFRAERESIGTIARDLGKAFLGALNGDEEPYPYSGDRVSISYSNDFVAQAQGLTDAQVEDAEDRFVRVLGMCHEMGLPAPERFVDETGIVFSLSSESRGTWDASVIPSPEVASIPDIDCWVDEFPDPTKR